jgi:CRISPR-associated protein Cmr2
MPAFHLDISIGPVGDFIAGGRRSRDLWWGSTWVSECTLAVADELRTSPGAGLQVPSRERLAALIDLAPGRRPTYGARVANHIRAVVEAPTADAVATLVRGLAARAHHRLADILSDCRARRRATDLDLLVDPDVWDRQLAALRDGDFLELTAAWSVDGARASARLLAAAKSLRRFDRPPGDAGRPKSHLDPGRDSVLTADASPRHLRARARLGLGRDEQLDAVSLARRLAQFEDPAAPDLPPLPFPPISRIALDPWLAAAARDHHAHLDLLRERLFAAHRLDPYFALWCSAAVDPERPAAQPSDWRSHPVLPFDASILLEDGPATLRALWQRTLPDEPTTHLDAACAAVHALHRDLQPPQAYYALVAADGDSVGAALDQLSDDQVPDLVAALDEFADTAADDIRAHHGRAFYTGGDDVLAYVPLDALLWGPGGAAPGLLERLARRFDDLVNAVLRRILPDLTTSLSFGVAIAHVKDDLRAVRRCADDALTRAKRHRAELKTASPALCVRERVRSGEQRSSLGDLDALTADLRHWVDLCRAGELSQRSAHHLLELRDTFSKRAAKVETRASDTSSTTASESTSTATELRSPDTKPPRDDLGLVLARASEALRRRRRDVDAVPPPLTRRLAALCAWNDVRDLAHEFLLAERLLPARVLRTGGSSP